MLSESKIKWINSFQLKKNRDEKKMFAAEGVKLVSELLAQFKCAFLAYIEEDLIEDGLRAKAVEKVQITGAQYKKISSQKSPQGVFGIFEKPVYPFSLDAIKNQLSLALDDIQDPGNLGTIIRTADWFGVKDVFCSLHTADVYSPKVIQATMGAILRVRVHYVDLKEFLREFTSPKEREKSDFFTIYGTLMNSENIYEKELKQHGIIVMGNEGNGISPEILPFITEKLLIPGFPKTEQTSESLNVSIATAITLAEFRRRGFQ